MQIVLILFAFLALSNSWAEFPSHVIPSNSYEMYHCEDSKAPLFRSEFGNPVEMTIKADFEKLNDQKYNTFNRPTSTGILTYKDPHNGTEISIPVKVKARGKSRFYNCKYRPFKVEISKETKRIQKESGQITLFSKLGRKLKFVTSCKNNSWDIPRNGPNSLLMEYYIYKLFETLKTTTLNVQLVKINLLDKSENLYLEGYAFILEPEKRLAKRCKLTKPKEKKLSYYKRFDKFLPTPLGEVNGFSKPDLKADHASEFQMNLLNAFIINGDYYTHYQHNAIFLISPTENRLYYGPYDFDLAGIMRINKFQLEDFDYLDLGYQFRKLLNNEKQYPLELRKTQITHLIKNRHRIDEVVRNSLLSRETKDVWLSWFQRLWENIPKTLH